MLSPMTPAENEIGWDISFDTRTEKVLKVAEVVYSKETQFQAGQILKLNSFPKRGLDTSCMEYTIYILAKSIE